MRGWERYEIVLANLSSRKIPVNVSFLWYRYVNPNVWRMKFQEGTEELFEFSRAPGFGVTYFTPPRISEIYSCIRRPQAPEINHVHRILFKALVLHRRRGRAHHSQSFPRSGSWTGHPKPTW